jgi:hypothetical protein
MQTLKELQEESRWLIKHASNVTSQFGEDGIIGKALELLPERNRWCIEFGAWDGKKYSNTYNLITAHGYRGVLIEADPVRFRDLQCTHDAQKNILINAAVGFTERDSLETLLRSRPLHSTAASRCDAWIECSGDHRTRSRQRVRVNLRDFV